MILYSEGSDNLVATEHQPETGHATAKPPATQSAVRAKSRLTRHHNATLSAGSTGPRVSGAVDPGTNLHGPLSEFLRKQVGRPWARIWRELRLRAAVSGTNCLALRNDVENFVATQVCVARGKLVHTTGLWAGQPLTGSWRQRFYVCPKTGVLELITARQALMRCKARRVKN